MAHPLKLWSLHESRRGLLGSGSGCQSHAAPPILIYELLEDVVALRRGESFADTTMADYLPPSHRHRYDQLFAKRFLACVYTVAWKLVSPDPQVLACVGEELALHALIERAESMLNPGIADADFSALYEAAFEDEDFVLLFDPQWDGIENAEAGARLGVANLRPDAWFAPFRDEFSVHPYSLT
jgi:hypothetical protein